MLSYRNSLSNQGYLRPKTPATNGPKLRWQSRFCAHQGGRMRQGENLGFLTYGNP